MNLSELNKLFDYTCINKHTTDCRKIGKLNRFNELKGYDCICYFNTEHRKSYNNDFTINDFCVNCQRAKVNCEYCGLMLHVANVCEETCNCPVCPKIHLSCVECESA